MSLDDFEDWFVASSWNAHQHADLEVQRLIGAIELALAEYSNDHRTEAEVRALLQSFVLPQHSGTTKALADGVISIDVSTVQGIGHVALASPTSANLVVRWASSAAGSQPVSVAQRIEDDLVPA